MAKKIIKKPKINVNDFQCAIHCFQSGNLRQGEMICRRMLERNPRHAEAWHLLGLIAVKSGHLDGAIHCFSSAARSNPHETSYHFNLGNACTEKGDHNGAIDAFKNALALRDDYVNAWLNLGNALSAKGRDDEAIESFRRVTALDPDNAAAYNNLGNEMRKKGMVDEALEAFAKALELRPDYANACNNMGSAFLDKGMIDEALECFRKALTLGPDNGSAYINLGNALRKKGLADEALEAFKKALSLGPDYAGAHRNLGVAFLDKDLVDAAIENFRRALYLEPGNVEAHNNLAAALIGKGLPDEAIEICRKALDLDPGNVETYNNLAFAFVDKGMPEEAIKNCEKALSLKPDSAEAYNNMGVALCAKGLPDGAIANYRTALSLNPDFGMAYNNLAGVLCDKGELEEAFENHRKALELAPHDFDMHNNFGMTCLLAKDFEKGWKEYEWRLKSARVQPLPKPKWDGSPLEGKTILVCAEQGHGDTIQFVRYLHLLHEAGAGKVYFKLNMTGLEQLLEQSCLGAEILSPSASIEDIAFDTNIHLMSLPRIFRTNLENIPFRQNRYLKADEKKVKWYRENFFNSSAFNLQPSACKIGIFWYGSPTFKGAKDKAIPLHYLYSLARLPQVKVFSLQKGHGIEQLKEAPEDIRVIDPEEKVDSRLRGNDRLAEIVNLGKTFKDFSDTAAAIANLDLVITIDTAVAHLSGALGKKTWLLHPSFAEWRWHLDMDYSPWYEEFRIFRHKVQGKKDWGEMMGRVMMRLEAELLC